MGIEPYPEQAKVLKCRRRKILMAGGERAGKSFTAATYLATRAPYGKLFWIVGPDYEQATAEFDYMVDFFTKLDAVEGPRAISRPKVGSCSMRLKTGQLIQTKSSDDVRKIASKAPDGIIMAEAAQHTYESYLKCLGRVAETRGWVFLSGTFEGSEGWYVELFNEWAISDNPEQGVSFSLPSWANTKVYPLGFADPEIQALRRAYRKVEGLFEERCGAVPIPPVGLVFREFNKVHHVTPKAKYDSRYPVYLAVDPSAGEAPYSVLACQFVPCGCNNLADPDSHHEYDKIEFCRVIDEMYIQGKVGEEVIALARRKKWWKSVRGGAIDVEAPDEQRRWLKYGGVYLKADKVPQLHGIRREKSFLHFRLNEDGTYAEVPHLQIAPHIEGLPYEYTKYKRKDPTDEDLIPKAEPVSNQPNHSIKALWYLLVARYGYVKGKPLPKVAKTYNRGEQERIARRNMFIKAGESTRFGSTPAASRPTRGRERLPIMPKGHGSIKVRPQPTAVQASGLKKRRNGT